MNPGYLELTHESAQEGQFKLVILRRPQESLGDTRGTLIGIGKGPTRALPNLLSYRSGPKSKELSHTKFRQY